MIAQTKFVPSWKPMLVRRLREGRPLSIAAGLVGVGMGKLADERRVDPNFDKQIEDALANPRKTLQW